MNPQQNAHQYARQYMVTTQAQPRGQTLAGQANMPTILGHPQMVMGGGPVIVNPVTTSIHPQQQPGAMQQIHHQMPGMGQVPPLFPNEESRQHFIAQLPPDCRSLVMNERSIAKQDQILSNFLSTKQRMAAQHRQALSMQARIPQQQAPVLTHSQPMQFHSQQQPISPESSHHPMGGVTHAIYPPRSQPPVQSVQQPARQLVQAASSYVPAQGATLHAHSSIPQQGSTSQHNSPMSIPQGGPHSAGAPLVYQPGSVPGLGSSPQAILSNTSSTGGPASVINAARSVPSVQPPPSVSAAQTGGSNSVDETSPEYICALNRLKEYREKITRLLCRIERDVEYHRKMGGENAQELKLLTSVRRVMEIIDGKRQVEAKLLERLVNNLKSSINNTNPSKGILDIARRLGNSEHALTLKDPLPDPWRNLRHLEIRLPAKLMLEMQNQNGLNPHVAGQLPRSTNGRSHFEEQGTGSEKGQRDSLAEIFSLNAVLGEELKGLGNVSCLLDPDFAPVTRESCSNIPLIIKYASPTTQPQKISSKHGNPMNSGVRPLRLLVPFSYPDGRVELLSADSISMGGQNQRIVERLAAWLDSNYPGTPRAIEAIVRFWSEITQAAT